jgi:hypothetical protein
MGDTIVHGRILTINEEGVTVAALGHEMQWPASALPAGVRAGDDVALKMMTTNDEQEERLLQARAILAEILGSRP